MSGGRRQTVFKSIPRRPIRAIAALGLSLALLPLSACGGKRPPAQKLPMELLKNDRKKRKEAPTTGEMVGVVLDPAGARLDFALVTAVSVKDDPESGQAPHLTTAIRRGKFELKGIPPGRYGLTVTAPIANAIRGPGFTGKEPVFAGAFAGVFTVSAGEAGPPILVRLSPEALVWKGRVTDDAGAPVAGALVRAVRESPLEGDQFFAKTDDDGRFFLGLPQGRYFLVGQAPGKRPVRADVRGNPGEIALALPPALTLPPAAEMAAWVSNTGGPLSLGDAATPAELAKLSALTGTARLVGFGEASYTGSEALRIKERMFRSLVLEKGFSVLFLEAAQADVRAIDTFVRTGQGKVQDLLARLGYFSLDTEEMASVLHWIRAYNEDRSHKTKIRVMGVDVQRTAAAATALSAYLPQVDKNFADKVETTITRFRDEEHVQQLRLRPAPEQDAALADLESIAERLEKDRRVLIAKTTWGPFNQASEDAAALVWAARIVKDERQRAAAMADVTLRALSVLPKGTKGVLWAHSSQISKREADAGMGAVLAKELGAQYVSFGMTFYQGWIRAWDFTSGPTLEHGTKLFRFAPAEPGSLEALLDTAGSPMFFADVRKAPDSLRPWLSAPLQMRNAGAVHTSEHLTRAHTVVAEAFDALVFIRKLTVVKFHETGKRPGRREPE